MPEPTVMEPVVSPTPTEPPAVPPAEEAKAQAKAPEKAEPSKAPEPKKTRKLKVNGVEEEVDEESLILAGVRAEQKERAAAAKWAEAQKARKEVEDFQKTWEQDPVAALDRLGPRARQAAEQFLMRELQKEQMDPNQRAMMEMQQKLRAMEEEKNAKEQALQQEKESQLQAHYAQVLDKEFAEVMAQAGLPKTTESVRLLAHEATLLADMGIPPTRDQLLAVVPVVRGKISKMAQETMTPMDGVGLLKFLGPDLRKKIRAAELALVKGAQPEQKRVEPSSPSSPQRNESRMLTHEEWKRKYAGDLDD